MKHLLFITCLLICCALGYGQSSDPLPPPPPRKSMKVSPAEILQDNHSLTISFNLNLGRVAVNIIRPTGANAYQCTIDATAGTKLPVGTAGWTNGSYIVRITGEQGDIVCELVYSKE